MYPSSSQRQYWTFQDKELVEFRNTINQDFIEKHGQNMDPANWASFFLTPQEELILLRQYEQQLKEFCKKFDPPMPKYVVGTALHYFKRFYLHKSTMDYHPKEILATCVYLSCKVEEFNVSIVQFVANIKGDRSKAMDIILSNELLLMQELNYYLTIHNPFRPVEGFLIDIKTRCHMNNPDRLRPGIDEFLDKTFLSDACLIFAPSQIALAAVLHAASKEQENLDSYVTESLFDSAKDKLPILIDSVRKIRSLVKNLGDKDVPKEKMKLLEKKLEKCRNQEFNPSSQLYKQRMMKLYEDDELDTSYHINSPDCSGDVSMLSTGNMTID